MSNQTTPASVLAAANRKMARPLRTPEQERIIRERDDLAMIKDEDMWTHWPVLPVVNRRVARLIPEDLTDPFAGYGLIMAGSPTKVWLTNLFIRDPKAPVKEYPCIEALLEDGWKVD